MHCVSCEVLLERKLKDISWVKVNMVSYKKWILEIEYKNNSDYKKVTNVIEEAWYNIINDNNENKNIKSGFLVNIVAVLVVMILLILANLFDLYKYIPDTSTLSYSWSFLIWIIASLSTCLALVWWIVIWFSNSSKRWTFKSSNMISIVKVDLILFVWLYFMSYWTDY